MKGKYIWGGAMILAGVLLIVGWFLNWSFAVIWKCWPVILILLGLSGAADHKKPGLWDILLIAAGILLLLRSLFGISISSIIWGPVLGAAVILAGIQLLFGDRKTDGPIPTEGKEIDK